MSVSLRTSLALALSLWCTAASAGPPPQRLALAWQDHIGRIAVAQQQLSADQADRQLRALAQGLSSEPAAEQLNALRRRLDEAFEGWLGAIEQRAATTTAWPAGRSAADWRLLVEVNVAQMREAMFDALLADEDPLPILQQAARVHGWTRGEQLPEQPLSGHEQRVGALAGGGSLPPTKQAPAEPPLPSTLQRLDFDRYPLGPLPPDAFAGTGVRIVQRDGVPGIYAADAASMRLPDGRSQVLLVAGQRTTALTFEFATPVRRFSLTRIGTAGGASVPTWSLQAFDGKGEILGATGAEYGLPPAPEQFSIDAAGIAKVVLSTDNRFGEGTLATWNSLPVAEFAFER